MGWGMWGIIYRGIIRRGIICWIMRRCIGRRGCRIVRLGVGLGLRTKGEKVGLKSGGGLCVEVARIGGGLF